VCARKHTCMCACMCVYVRLYVCMCVCLWVWMCAGVNMFQRVHLRYYKTSVEIRGSSRRVVPWRMSAEGSARGEGDARL